MFIEIESESKDKYKGKVNEWKESEWIIKMSIEDQSTGYL
jgi:hypothetical protein